MTVLQLLAIGIRLGGIALLILSIKEIVHADQLYSMQLSVPNLDQSGYALTSVFLAVGYLLLSFLFIKFPATVSRWLLPKTQDESTVIKGSFDEFQGVCLVIIGIYILTWAVPDLVHNISRIVFLGELYEYNDLSRREDKLYLFSTLVEILVGLFLVFGSRGISSLVARFRYAGRT